MRKKIAITALLLVLASTFIASQEGAYTEKKGYDASDRLQYYGRAVPGTAEATAGWQILRITYDGTSSRRTAKEYAEGNEGFVHKWTLRATLSYN